MSPPAARRLRALGGRPETWGLLDQGLVSTVNFLTVILLARRLAPGDFGTFVLAFTVLQSAGTLQAALVTRPHNVLGAVRRGREYADYSTTAAAAQAALTGVLALAAGVAALVAWSQGAEDASLLAAVVPALVGWQAQELLRRMLYTERRLRAALANDLVAYGGQASALVALLAADRLTGASALLTLAVAFAVAACLGAWQLRSTLRGRVNAASLGANWHFGKWLGVAEIGQWFATQYYIYLAAAVVGAIASGALKAGQTLLGPMSVFLTFVTSYLPIVLARERAASGSDRRTALRSLELVVPVVLAYCGLVAVFAEPLLRSVYGAEYDGYVSVVRLFAAYYAVLALSTVAIAALSARGLTRDVFVGQAAGAVVSLAVGWWLLDRFGAAGGVTGMLVSWVAAMAWFVRVLRRPSGRVANVVVAPVSTPVDGV